MTEVELPNVAENNNETSIIELQKINTNLEVLSDYIIPTDEEIAQQKLDDADALRKLEQTPKEETVLGQLQLINSELNYLIEDNQEQQSQTTSEEHNIISHLSVLNEKVDDLVEGNSIIEGASSSIIAYSILYIPLIIIVISLWWFFKQFLTRFF